MQDPRLAPVIVESFAAADRDEVLAVLARAFWPDPVFGYFARHRLHEHHVLPAVFHAFLADAAPFGECTVARAGDRIVGAAAWLPPAGMPRSRGRDLALQGRIVRPLLTGRHQVRGLGLLDAVGRAHPHDPPHWYLALLGTDPVLQGRGIGGQLLAPVLARADAEGVGAYLETQKERNIAYYRRFGFDVRDEISRRGTPTVWTMWRDPRPT